MTIYEKIATPLRAVGGICLYGRACGLCRRQWRTEGPGAGFPDFAAGVAGESFRKVVARNGAVAAAQAQLPATRSGVATCSGVGGIDAILHEIDAGRFERVVAYNPEWEDVYEQTGINRWYTIAFDDEIQLSEVGERLAALPGVAVVEYGIDPRYIRR